MEQKKMTLWDYLTDEEHDNERSIAVYVNGLYSFKGTYEELYAVVSYQLMEKLKVVRVMYIENSDTTSIDTEVINND